MLRVAYAITLDKEVAREIAQEAFLRLWERRDQFAAGSNEAAWLMRVTTNLAISHRRGVLARLRYRPAEPAEADPAALAITRMEGHAMRLALLDLKPRERAVLALRYQQGLSFADVGAALGRPEATMRTWCHRALEKLQRRLESAESHPLVEEPS